MCEFGGTMWASSPTDLLICHCDLYRLPAHGIVYKNSHMYLKAVIDWFSRYIVVWALSDTLETAPVLDAVQGAIEKYVVTAIINSDQGSQFTSEDYMRLLAENNIRQSMDGKRDGLTMSSLGGGSAV